MKPKIYLHFDNIPVEKHDISLANRIQFWETLYHLNNLNNNYFEISLERKFYKDLDNLITFPNTSQHNESQIPKHSVKLGKHELKKLINNKARLNRKKNYYFVLDEVQSFHHFEIMTPHPRPMINLQFHPFIYESVRNITDNHLYIGVHVRRGDGVMFNDEFYETLSANAKSFVKPGGCYTFYDDSYYHPFMKKITDINKNQRFYISHDLTYEDMKYWKKEFNDETIIFNHDLFENVFDYFTDVPFDVISAVVDLLFLFYNHFNIINDESTFSQISAHDISKFRYDIKSITKKLDYNTWERFIENYKKYVEKS